jgi:membrane protease YdiL (CAAX protease family)
VAEAWSRHTSELRTEQARATARRLRSLGWFLLAGIYAVCAHQFAARTMSALAAGPYAAGPYASIAGRLLFVLLLLAGFAAMGLLGRQQTSPLAAVGLPRRPGFGREWALGAALGWAGIVLCVLPVALTGGLLFTAGTSGKAASAGAAVLDLLALAAAALADELVFRGYPFQRLIEVTGPTLATILMTLLFTLGRESSSSSPGSLLVTLLLGVLLAMAYLRTRALWVGWGFHFAWNASMAVLFGLPLSGLTEFSPVFSTYTTGTPWLTGGRYGPEGSAIAILVLLGLLIAIARATRDLHHRWAFPEIVGAGIPVDIDAISQRQHEKGMGSGVGAGAEAAIQPPAGSQLVQIAPFLPQPSPPSGDADDH